MSGFNEIMAKNWKNILKEELNKKYLKELMNIIELEQKKNKIFPPKEEIFYALNICPFKKIKIVILGQDPYHNRNQAHGLCFSTTSGNKTPASLKNIFKEIKNDLNIIITNTNLSGWGKQGILLLNSILTVRLNKPGSHKRIGWEIFTNNIIKTISEKKEGVIFMLWGKYAKEKKKLIDKKKHFILEAAHPSPLSAYRGFFGCKHFSKANNILVKNHKQRIEWEI